MLGGERKWSTQSTNNFTGARNQQHGSLGNLCLTVPFLIACGRPNQERSSLPVLTVLLLLGGEHLVEGGRVERRGDWTSGVRTQGSFFEVSGGPGVVLLDVLLEMGECLVFSSQTKS